MICNRFEKKRKDTSRALSQLTLQPAISCPILLIPNEDRRGPPTTYTSYHSRRSPCSLGQQWKQYSSRLVKVLRVTSPNHDNLACFCPKLCADNQTRKEAQPVRRLGRDSAKRPKCNFFSFNYFLEQQLSQTKTITQTHKSHFRQQKGHSFVTQLGTVRPY